MKKLLLLILLSFPSIAQQQHCTISTYNILNYPANNDTTIRNPYFREIMQELSPDILVVQEITSQAGVDGFLNNVLLSFGEQYLAGEFINGTDTDNAVFYNPEKFSFISNVPINTELRDINEFTLAYKNGIDTLRLYSLHLKASQGSSNEEQRAREVDSLRKVTNALHPESNFIIIGDFNIYYSGELAYQKLLDQNLSGYVLDPIDRPGDWHNNISFADIHTQSPRTREFGGGAPGGMDDRFDMILVSQSIINNGGIYIVDSSYNAYGNDGMHFNDSLNAPPNYAVTQEMANALHYASDHIPVIIKIGFDEPTFVNQETSIPVTAELFNAYPNPFNPTTTINYQIPIDEFVSLKVLDVLGREVAQLVNENKLAGLHQVYFAANSLTSGFYFYQLKVGSFIETKKMILLK